MIRHRPYHTVVALLCVFFFLVGVTSPPPAFAFGLGSIGGNLLKIAGFGFLVNHFGGQINNFINKALGQRGIQREGMTKVVPVVRIGRASAVGAVQVVGPQEQVQKVKAVAEVEVGLGNSIRGRGLIPIAADGFNVASVHGVGGVGVSADIKLRL
jgi:hypothetical protein